MNDASPDAAPDAPRDEPLAAAGTTPAAASTERDGAGAPAESDRPAAIQVVGLSKRFTDTPVLDAIDLTVPQGQVFGYIGPNGAGKSTTVKILIGLLGAFEGDVRVAGLDVRTDAQAVKARIGYVPENAVLYEALTVDEHLMLVGRLHGLEDDRIRARCLPLLEGFELEGRRNSRIGALSKGMRQKILFCSALLHDPEILFLDEPLSGLDVGSTILIKDLLNALARRGKTIFYCSHIMDVVERVCDRIVILKGGRIAADGSYESLAAQSEASGSLESIFVSVTDIGTTDERIARILSATDDSVDPA